MVVAVQFNADNLLAATRKKFQRDAACAGEEVESRGSIEINILNEYIEDVLLGTVP